MEDRVFTPAAASPPGDALPVPVEERKPELLPLTPVEVGRLAELRATPNLPPAGAEEMAALAAREAEPPAPDAAAKPDAALVAGLTVDTLTHVVSLVESMAGLLPMAHSFASRIAAMRASLVATVFHASPPEEPPPPPAA